MAGRLVARRKHRHATFLDLRDRSGVIELCVKRDRLGETQCSQLVSSDLGDIVSAEGTVYVTDNHTLTLSVTSSQLLAKALRWPPAMSTLRGSAVMDDRAGHGQTTAADTRHRQRELELLASEWTRGLFEVRSSATKAIRHWLGKHEFVEVEAPVLERRTGGPPVIAPTAAGTPPTLPLAVSGPDRPSRGLVLRRSSRAYMRACLLSGLERVYELGKRFPSDQRGCCEVTMLEWAAAYIDCREAACQAEALIVHTAAAIVPEVRLRRDGQTIDLRGPWRSTSLRECILESCGVDILAADAATLASRLAHAAGATRSTRHRSPTAGTGEDSWASVVLALYATFVEPKLIEPTIVYGFPVTGRALVRKHPLDERLAADFRVVAGAVELAAGNGELNDPHERWARAQRQSTARDSGTPLACPEHELRLLEYGLCPAASFELHVDRLLMLLTASATTRDVIPFPAFASGSPRA
ncbi:MAG TPA: amino acid--tRNA ligase-related protein [Solirubrobacteraceae bacterium]|nr:amino acid--tRNA ligase-related protein [Solirubrobacteraceae bacterium]